MSNKRLIIQPDQLKSLILGKSICFAYDLITVAGRKVDYMYREEPENEIDSGWWFLSGNQSQEYLNNPENYGIYDLNFIANCDPDVLPFLDAPYFSAFERDSSGNFVVFKEDDEIAYEQERDKVIAEITAAFRDVKCEDGVTLHEAIAMDDYDDRAAARLKDTEKCWEEVSLIEHRYNDAVLAFFDAKGFRYYIPAYMIWFLRNPQLSSNINGTTVTYLRLPGEGESFRKETIERFHLMTPSQSSAICGFLECLVRHGHHAGDARAALASYWSHFSKEIK